ncbi:MAG: molybdenum cofactor guanylyltransferase [Pirellulaceae bacterium]
MAEIANNFDYMIPAIILSGGRSRRMGRNKATLPLGQETVLQRVESVFASIADPLVLVIGRDSTAPGTRRARRVVRDEHADFGPLEGLRIGLESVRGDGAMAMVGTCDAPLVVPEVYTTMSRRLLHSSEHDAVMPLIEGQHHPLTAVYRVSVLPEIEEMVQRKQLRVRDLLKRINVLEMGADELRGVDPQLRTIRNINTPEEYQRMLEEL